MAFDLINNVVEVPTATTVESYTLYRLGTTQRLHTTYAETIPMVDENNTPICNDFGIPANRLANTGRRWELVLNTNDPQHLQYMGNIMVTVYMTAIKAFLEAISDTTITDEQIQMGVMALTQQGITIDDFITGEVEKVEKLRRTGDLRPSYGGGQMP